MKPSKILQTTCDFKFDQNKLLNFLTGQMLITDRKSNSIRSIDIFISSLSAFKMADGHVVKSQTPVIQLSQQLQIVSSEWKPLEEIVKSSEPIGAEEESREPIEELEEAAGLWNKVGIYAVGKILSK